MDHSLLADEQLLRLLQEGDPLAFHAIYLRYWQRLYLTALKKVHVKEVAEELVQNLFIDLWDKRASCTILSLQAYLQTSIKYQVINYIKSVLVRKRYRQLVVSVDATDNNASETTLLVHELSAAIDRALKQLPEKTQTVFRLSRYDNQTVREISRTMNLSEKAVEYHITQSLKVLRLHLKDFIFLMLLFYR